MQKLFLNCYEMDKRCYEQFGLSEDLLMENAALGISNYIKSKFAQSSVYIAAGPGNNGADGIAVARALANAQDVYLHLPLGAKSKMAQLQLQRAKAAGVQIVQEAVQCDITVDALFGAGLNKQLPAAIQTLLVQLNQIDNFKIACDIPTGVLQSGAVTESVFEAHKTFTMGALKSSLFSDLALDFIGSVEVVDLGVSRQNYELQSDSFLLEQKDMQLPFRKKKFSHKGDFGHLNVLVGQKQGAAILCAKAAMGFGTGLVSLITNEAVTASEELMIDTHISQNCCALCVGMGLGNEYADSFLESEVVQNDIPVVLDADSFSNPLLLQILEQDRTVVATPHPKEFVQLLNYLGIDITVQELLNNRLYYVKRFCRHYRNAVLLLKGANSIIAQNESIYINPYHSAKLSQAGSGDVLSGLVGALLAQNYNAKDAAITASLALSFAAKSYRGSNFTMDARDLIAQIKSL